MSFYFTEPVGERAQRIACLLWPDLRPTMSGGVDDKSGTDAKDALGSRWQIKGDIRIFETGNVYREFYEKTKGRHEQKWRSSPHVCDGYIFVTCGIALKVPIDAMAELELGQPLRQISPTSIGVMVSIAFFGSYLRWHDFWPPTDHQERLDHWAWYFRRPAS
jgi:hypothetical protein